MWAESLYYFFFFIPSLLLPTYIIIHFLVVAIDTDNDINNHSDN
jgi:hypothetical protein